MDNSQDVTAGVDLTGKRYCYWIPESQDPSEHGGYVPAIVIANESGYYPLTGDPKKFQLPWIFGKTLAAAQEVARERNERMGLSIEDVVQIITSSMNASFTGFRTQ